jgi:VIT1/CCC1 family predicted Fe2+/Mn2+ transporter
LFFLSGTFTLTFFYLIAKIGGINFKKYAVWAILFWIIVVPMLIYLVLYYCLT